MARYQIQASFIPSAEFDTFCIAGVSGLVNVPVTKTYMETDSLPVAAKTIQAIVKADDEIINTKKTPRTKAGQWLYEQSIQQARTTIMYRVFDTEENKGVAPSDLGVTV